MKTFRVWLRRFEDDNNAIGDLARDIKDDNGFPTTNKHNVILEYLYERNACYAALYTFQRAWDLYKQSEVTITN